MSSSAASAVSISASSFESINDLMDTDTDTEVKVKVKLEGKPERVTAVAFSKEEMSELKNKHVPHSWKTCNLSRALRAYQSYIKVLTQTLHITDRSFLICSVEQRDHASPTALVGRPVCDMRYHPSAMNRPGLSSNAAYPCIFLAWDRTHSLMTFLGWSMVNRDDLKPTDDRAIVYGDCKVLFRTVQSIPSHVLERICAEAASTRPYDHIIQSRLAALAHPEPGKALLSYQDRALKIHEVPEGNDSARRQFRFHYEYFRRSSASSSSSSSSSSSRPSRIADYAKRHPFLVLEDRLALYAAVLDPYLVEMGIVKCTRMTVQQLLHLTDTDALELNEVSFRILLTCLCMNGEERRVHKYVYQALVRVWHHLELNLMKLRLSMAPDALLLHWCDRLLKLSNDVLDEEGKGSCIEKLANHCYRLDAFTSQGPLMEFPRRRFRQQLKQDAEDSKCFVGDRKLLETLLLGFYRVRVLDPRSARGCGHVQACPMPKYRTVYEKRMSMKRESYESDREWLKAMEEIKDVSDLETCYSEGKWEDDKGGDAFQAASIGPSIAKRFYHWVLQFQDLKSKFIRTKDVKHVNILRFLGLPREMRYPAFHLLPPCIQELRKRGTDYQKGKTVYANEGMGAMALEAFDAAFLDIEELQAQGVDQSSIIDPQKKHVREKFISAGRKLDAECLPWSCAAMALEGLCPFKPIITIDTHMYKERCAAHTQEIARKHLDIEIAPADTELAPMQPSDVSMKLLFEHWRADYHLK